MRTFPWIVAVAAACHRDDGPEPDLSPPAFDEVERVVTVGDNAASNPSYSRSYVALLEQNDDEVFPEFAGKDLTAALPGAELIRLDRGGDGYFALADAQDAIRTCPDASGCVDPDDDRATLVIVQLGVNDLVATALAMISDPARRENPDGEIASFRTAVRAVLDQVAGGPWTRPPRIAVTNLVDPSDGVGDVAELVTTFFPFEGAEDVSPELALAIIDGFNGAIADEAAAVGADVVDLHAAWLGHGWHYDEDTAPFYDAGDPSFWFHTVIDPNLRGAHEIRRELWATLTGERVDVLPGELPPDDTFGLPAVPANGWANAVVESVVTDQLVDDDGTVFPNVAADVEMILGEPDATALGGAVALGVIGAYAIVDLGEGEAATDGEGDDLVVLEFGAQSGGVPEPYRVSVATDPAGPWVQIADGFGERSFDLADTGLTSARYVKIESLAQQADVLGGVGSPYYPGGEFDAVGAVYPGP